MMSRHNFPSDVSDEEWALVASYFALLLESAAQREQSLREVFNGPLCVGRYGVPWRTMLHDLPAWHAMYEQAQRWLRAVCVENLIHDLRIVLRLAWGRAEKASAVVVGTRTPFSTPETGTHAASEGHKRTWGSKPHMAIDTLGRVLALYHTPSIADERAAVATFADAVQEATDDRGDLAYVDQGYRVRSATSH